MSSAVGLPDRVDSKGQREQTEDDVAGDFWGHGICSVGGRRRSLGLGGRRFIWMKIPAYEDGNIYIRKVATYKGWAGTDVCQLVNTIGCCRIPRDTLM